MDQRSTFDATLALRWSNEVLGAGNPAAFFLAPARFVAATRTDDSFSLTLSGDVLFGMGCGPHPLIDPEWRRWMLSDAQGSGELALPGSDHWDFYSINARSAHVDGDVATLDDATAISELLRIHAADSSVWPANPEIVDWYGLRDEDDDLVSLGALVRWESGLHVLASIATVTEKRGRGYAQELTQGIVARAREQGIEWLGLGVSHANVAAQRVYQKAGFTLRANFTTFASP